MLKHQLSALIKSHALSLGFSECGIAKAEQLTDEARYLEAWLNQDKHGKMGYMANHFDKRTDPRLLVDGAKSVISLSYNYYNPHWQQADDKPKIAMYAAGEDYHDVIREKLNMLLSYVRSIAGNVQGRGFVDSAPVLERAWAQRSGIGWVGKNTNLLTKRRGSFFFLAELIIDLELEYDSPIKDYCGTCTRCVDACPTQAIYEPYKLDGSKCISYFTIELRDEVLPSEYKGKFEGWMYGCDICQQVCPINSQSQPHHEPRFNPGNDLLNMSRTDWEELTEDTFKALFKHSPVKRTRFAGLKRNIEFLKQ